VGPRASNGPRPDCPGRNAPRRPTAAAPGGRVRARRQDFPTGGGPQAFPGATRAPAPSSSSRTSPRMTAVPPGAEAAGGCRSLTVSPFLNRSRRSPRQQRQGDCLARRCTVALDGYALGASCLVGGRLAGPTSTTPAGVASRRGPTLVRPSPASSSARPSASAKAPRCPGTSGVTPPTPSPRRVAPAAPPPCVRPPTGGPSSAVCGNASPPCSPPAARCGTSI
jgi:hypothetical protein